MENNQYDFYDIGSKYAMRIKEEIKLKAKEIEEQFGKVARENFELGVASNISQYERISTSDVFDETSIQPSKDGFVHASKDPGLSQYVNNSYFGKTGVKRKY